MQVSLCNRTASRAQEFADYMHRYDPYDHGSATCITETDQQGSGASGLSPELEKDIRSTLPADTWQTAHITAHIKEADIIIYTLPGPSDILTHLLSSTPDIFSDKTLLEANYKSPVLSFTPCRRYISGLIWLRLQALATYRIVIGR